MLGKKEMNDTERKGELNTIIGKGSELQGSLTVQHSLRIDGKVKGNLTADDSLVVGRDGFVEGDIRVKNAVIGGRVEGNIRAEGKVVLEANSFFRGEMRTAKLVIDEGAIFEGKCSMSEENQPAPPPDLRPKGIFSREKRKDDKPDLLNPKPADE